MFAAIRTAKRDSRDDGTVVHGHNLDEEPTALSDELPLEEKQ
jgi:hypothetical protein